MLSIFHFYDAYEIKPQREKQAIDNFKANINELRKNY
jgi:hypothetical protein